MKPGALSTGPGSVRSAPKAMLSFLPPSPGNNAPGTAILVSEGLGLRCRAAEFRAGFLPRSLHPNAVRGNSIAASPPSL